MPSCSLCNKDLDLGEVKLLAQSHIHIVSKKPKSELESRLPDLEASAPFTKVGGSSLLLPEWLS